MQAVGVGRLVFSSSATVYGDPDVLPITELAPTRATNPYGGTLMAEEIIGDVCATDSGLSAVLLRYFDPVGAHPSGLIGEVPEAFPTI